MFEQTITVWSRAANEIYTRKIIHNVYWEDNRGEQLRKTGTSEANGIICIIAPKSAPDGFSIMPHDSNMPGETALEPKPAKVLLAAGANFVSVYDCSRVRGLRHWAGSGQWPG